MGAMVGYVYIMTNKKNGTLYTGVTSDLGRRILEHKTGLVDGFTKRYELHTLIYAEAHDRIDDAIHREKCIKEWKREWKINLINSANPEWIDLSNQYIP